MASAPRRARRVCAISVAAVLPVLLLAPAADAAPKSKPHLPRTVDVRVMSFNDLHGNLEPPTGSSGRVTTADAVPATPTTPAVPAVTVDAGGAAYLATHLRQLEEEVDHSVVLSTGDNIGASPLASALFHDEPTIEVLNEIGVQASVVGNHEFDEGFAELQRIQRGGCHPDDGCKFEESFQGAQFPYLGANVTRTSGAPALMPFTVEVRGGVPIGIIGVALRGVPDVVVPSAVAGLRFGDEVAAINRSSRLLRKVGVKAQVVLVHQGDETTGTGGPDACSLRPGAGAAATQIATAASADVDAVFAAHTHQAENCTVTDPAGKPRPLVQGLSFGRLVSVVDITIDTRSRDVVRDRTEADNVVVSRDVTPDPEVAAIVDRAVTQSAPLANAPVGSITADLVRGAAPEQPLGDVIADAQLAATTSAGAQVAITNPGGIRADLTYATSPAGEGAGVVTYGEAFTVQPFANILQTITLTGADLKAVLEQQDQAGGFRWLQISSTLRYTWTTSAADGSNVSDLTIAGQPVDPAVSYRVTVNNFLAGGGDGFTAFTRGTNLTGGPIDLDAFTAYLTANPNLSPPPANRITVVP